MTRRRKTILCKHVTEQHPALPDAAGESMRTHTPECSVIIPVYNKWELTRNCLASLHLHSSAHDLEVIVVDNGSSDATATDLVSYGRNLFGERFTAIVFSENRNFGPACNSGARAATSPVLFFLNNDTLLTPDWFPPLLKNLHALGPHGAVGPLLLYEDGLIQHMGVTFGLSGPFHLYSYFPANHPVVSRKRELQAITGAALMIRADCFHGCGGFFEAYRNGFEDVDLCVQIRRQGGALRCIPSSVVYHLESQTPGRKNSEDKNGELLVRRCSMSIYPDFHLHLLRDGFEFYISDLLTICAKLTAKEDVALRKKIQGKEAVAWFQLVKENPFWEYGREVLAHSYEKQNRYLEASVFRAELADFSPSATRYQDLLRLAPLVTEKPWLQTVEHHLRVITCLRNDHSYARTVVSKIRRRFRNGMDALLENALASKLKE